MSRSLPVVIGTSGWQYRHWRETFYPRGVAQVRWLEHYAERFCTVESNAAFYRLPRPETFEAWQNRTPDDFVMAVKLNRYLTHIRRLRDPEEPMQRFLEAATRLGPKLGPVLIQLPPSMRADHERLDAVLLLFPPTIRVAVEFRHDSWFTAETERLLAARGAALCLTDRKNRKSPLWRTADWTYLRLHEGVAAPRPCYGRSALDAWAGRLADGWAPDEECFVYFNNDPRACALRDAIVFARLTERRGRAASRVPRSSDVRLG